MKASQILTVVGFLRASMAIPQYLPEGEYRPECPAPEYTKDVVEQRTRGPTSITGAFCPNRKSRPSRLWQVAKGDNDSR